MTFIYSVHNRVINVVPNPEKCDSIALNVDNEVYLPGLTVESAERLADLLMQAAMAMRLAGKE
jgi:hypothetical protein